MTDDRNEQERLRSYADSLGLVLGHAVAKRFIQLRGMQPSKDAPVVELVLKAVREMYVVLATSDDPFAAMDQTLELEAHFDKN